MKRNYLAQIVWMGAVLASCLLVSLDDKHVTAAQLPNTTVLLTRGSAASNEVIFHPDLIYHTVDGKPLRLDLVCPQAGEGPFPAVILLHGVGPTNKGKEGMLPHAQEFARKGYLGIAVSYRSKPEDAFPAPILDIRCAIRWLRDHANQYKIDKDRIGVVGFSGGGTLACLAAMKRDGLDANDKLPECPGGVQAVVSFYGPTDFARLHEGCVAKTKAKECCFGEKMQSSYIMLTLEKWFGGPPSRVPERYCLASPMSHVGKDSPPILLIHGAEDTVVPVEQSKHFAKKLQTSGRPVNLLVFEGAGHDFEDKNRTNGRLAFAAVLAFFDDHLLGIKGIR